MEATTEAVILILRLSMVGVLYLFLVALVSTLRRDITERVREAEEAAIPRPPGQLVVLDPGPTALRAGQSIPLRPITSLGRDPQNTIPLPDSSVSGRHAVLSQRNGTWWVKDLDSTNGTQVNQQVIRGEAELEVGDVIGVGRVRLKLSP